MKYIITETQLNNLLEQDDWVRKAASGPQKCGKGARWCKDDGGNSSVGEVPMSGKKLKKYTESEYWNSQLLTSPVTKPDYNNRISKISSEISSQKSKLSDDQKSFLVYNLTNKLNSSSSWFFSNIIKKALNVTGQISDKNVLDFIISKGGFDAFKKYYLEDIMG